MNKHKHTFADRIRGDGCEVSGNGDFVLELSSELYGSEYFAYETQEEQNAALVRLTLEAAEAFMDDDVARKVCVIIGWD